MTERFRFVIAGFFVGLAELLPGISGSTVAIAFKVYEKFISKAKEDKVLLDNTDESKKNRKYR